MRQTIVAVALLALAACPAVEGEVGPQGPEGPPGYSPLASGTRIKARVGATPDGAKLFLGWFDAERQENCSFRTAADGKVRCLPDVPVSTDAVFSDDQCGERVVLVKSCSGCPAPELTLAPTGFDITVGGATPKLGVFTVGAKFEGAVVSAIVPTIGCSPTSWVPGDRKFASAGEIPADQFAPLEEMVEN